MVRGVPLMFPLKQAIDKPMGQNLFGERGWIFPRSFAVAKTQVRNNRLQTEVKEES